MERIRISDAWPEGKVTVPMNGIWQIVIKIGFI